MTVPATSVLAYEHVGRNGHSRIVVTDALALVSRWNILLM